MKTPSKNTTNYSQPNHIRGKEKILIVRFSSFGDIIQCFSAADHLAQHFAGSEIHWVTRSDFAPFLSSHPHVHQVWSLNRIEGWKGLVKLTGSLRQQNFSYVYDAHSNLRSHLLVWLMSLGLAPKFRFIRRQKNRLRRLLLIRLKIKALPWPFQGAQSFVRPLQKWGIQWQGSLSRSLKLPPRSASPHNSPQTNLPTLPKQAIVLAPSAAWKMKRWPMESWKELILAMDKQLFVIVGGPEDHFCAELAQLAPQRVINLAGQLTWLETAQLLSEAPLVISGDTGVLHLSDYLGTPTLALIGPTAFGFPSWKNSQVLETDLKCRPCSKDGRGKCVQNIYQRCLVDIRPERVREAIERALP